MRGFVALLLCLVPAGCDERPDPPPPEVLATSVYFNVGDLSLAVPVVAVAAVSAPRSYSNRAYAPQDEDVGPRDAVRLAEQARDVRSPIRAGLLNLTADQYSIGPGRCGLFDRQWSRRLCERGRSSGNLKDLPDRVALVDRRYLSQFESHYSVGGENRSSQIETMGRLGSAPTLGCDQASKFCTAALAVSPGVLAVWTVWSGSESEERADRMAARQAPAILAWVRTEISVRK